MKKLISHNCGCYLLLLFLWQCSTVIVDGECEALGSTDKTSRPSVLPRSIISLNISATCNGTVKSWTYCYYLLVDADESVMYSATWAFYRIYKGKNNIYHYVVVNGSTFTARHNGREVEGRGDSCVTRRLNESEQFDVESGDVLGACLQTPFPLDIFGVTNTFRENIIQSSVCLSDSGNSSSTFTQLHLLLRAEFATSNSVAVGVGVSFAILIIAVIVAVTAAAIIFSCYSKKNSINSIAKWTKSMRMPLIKSFKRQQNSQTIEGTERKPITYRPASEKRINGTKTKQQKTDDNFYSPILDRIYDSPNLINQYHYEMGNDSNNAVYEVPANTEQALYEQLSTFSINNINPAHVRSVRYIGSGEFGTVEQGVLNTDSESVDVALKTLKDMSCKKNIVKFLQEAAIMIQFHHPNIISLLGIVSNDNIILVVEYADNGDLLSFLHNMKNSLSSQPLENEAKPCLQFCRDIAQGMLYLSYRGYIHRDLAARNVVLKGTSCKITDFGLSRELPADNVYRSSGGLIPLKWTALEALLQRKYSTASDVWSYGCVLYEIWSLGTKPFEKETCENVIKFLKSGHRLAPPPGCPLILYKIMIDTWNPAPDDRPTFYDVANALEREDTVILHIPQEEAIERAGELGAPLEEAKSMYRQLQTAYLK